MAGLNLLAAIIIYWNTKHLGKAVLQRRHDGLDCSADHADAEQDWESYVSRGTLSRAGGGVNPRASAGRPVCRSLGRGWQVVDRFHPAAEKIAEYLWQFQFDRRAGGCRIA